MHKRDKVVQTPKVQQQSQSEEDFDAITVEEVVEVTEEDAGGECECHNEEEEETSEEKAPTEVETKDVKKTLCGSREEEDPFTR